MLATGHDPNQTEDDEPQHGQPEDKHQKAGGRYTEIVDSLPQQRWPQRKQTDHDGTDHEQRPKDPVVHRDRVVEPNVRLVSVHKQLLRVHLEPDLALAFLLVLVGGGTSLALGMATLAPVRRLVVLSALRLVLFLLAALLALAAQLLLTHRDLPCPVKQLVVQHFVHKVDYGLPVRKQTVVALGKLGREQRVDGAHRRKVLHVVVQKLGLLRRDVRFEPLGHLQLVLGGLLDLLLARAGVFLGEKRLDKLRS